MGGWDIALANIYPGFVGDPFHTNSHSHIHTNKAVFIASEKKEDKNASSTERERRKVTAEGNRVFKLLSPTDFFFLLGIFWSK